MQGIREGLIEEFIENIVACSEMGTQDFLFDTEGGDVMRLSDVKI